MKTSYNKDYFEKGLETGKSLYSNYRWIPELTIPLAYRIIKHLGIKDNDKVMDYGCAMGYLVKSFRLLGIDAYGYDISEYALDNVPTDTTPYIYRGTLWGFKKWDWIVAKDVLEHEKYKNIRNTIKQFKGCAKRVFVVVPAGDGEKYNEPLYERDYTHVIRENLAWWVDIFNQNGFDCYWSDYKMEGIKENWTRPKSNIFLKLKNKDL